MRFYLSNNSYPELRDVTSVWQRQRIWWRAFRSAVRDWRVLAIVFLVWGGGILVLFTGRAVSIAFLEQATQWARTQGTTTVPVATPNSITTPSDAVDRETSPLAPDATLPSAGEPGATDPADAMPGPPPLGTGSIVIASGSVALVSPGQGINWWFAGWTASSIATPLLFGVWVTLPTITIAGDLVRPHLRRADIRCRLACPECGYHLGRQVEAMEARSKQVVSVTREPSTSSDVTDLPGESCPARTAATAQHDVIGPATEEMRRQDPKTLKSIRPTAEETTDDEEACRVRCPECGHTWPESVFKEPFSGLTPTWRRGNAG